MVKWVAHSLVTALVYTSCMLTFMLVVAEDVLAKPKLVLSQVQLDKQQWQPKSDGPLVVRYHINTAAEVTLHWFDARDLLISSITSQSSVSAGHHELVWDGKDLSGRWVPDEVYRFVLEAISADDGESVIYDLTTNTFGEEVLVDQVSWNPDTHRIQYRLAEPARVSVRIGLENNGPLLRTVLDWLPRNAGVHEESWDGWDQSKLIDVSKHPRLKINAAAFALGKNAVIIGEEIKVSQFVDPMPWPSIKRVETKQRAKRMYFHAQQPITERGDIDISLALMGDWPVDEHGRVIVSGIVPVSMQVAGHDQQRVLDRRFEPVFFVDGAFAFENEVGYLPTTWLWDTRGISTGKHFINANLRGYEGNFGMASLEVVVAREE